MLPLDVHSLRKSVANGHKYEYLCFYGHTPRPDGKLSNACFSQWYVAPFSLEGHTYPTAEHWMMACKARLFADGEILQKILLAPSPAEAKKLGREVRNFDGGKWNAARFDAVTRGNVAKFSASAELREYLLATGESILVEAAPRDTIWGIGLGASSEKARDPRTWRGTNLLGFALVRARAILRGELSL